MLEVEGVHSRVNGAAWQEQVAAAAASGPSGPHSRPRVLIFTQSKRTPPSGRGDSCVCVRPLLLQSVFACTCIGGFHPNVAPSTSTAETARSRQRST